MASFIYNSFMTKLLNGGGIDLDTDTIKVALTTSSYSPNQDTHDFFDDVTNEITGTGYSAGGATLGSKTVTQDDTNNYAVFDAADATWSNSTITARYAVVYKSTGTAGTSPLIALIDLAEDKTTNVSTFQITWNTDGILRLSTT